MAQNFPSKPIRIIVTFPAGGQADLLARVLGKYITQNTGQPGHHRQPRRCGKAWWARRVLANAAPDGYTIGMLSTPHITIPALMKPPFDPKLLRPITNIAIVPSLLSVNSASSIYTLHDLVAQARAKPGCIDLGQCRQPVHVPSRDGTAQVAGPISIS